MVVVDSAGELDTVIEGVDGKETLKFCEIWPVVTLVVLIFVFFPFPESVRGCNMAAQVGRSDLES